ncbi:hypothetical protein BX600DRAFT_437113 [Xylariales sp. PMI_506]|nr:hypothetical protein BX600DRAFT_437113 [Xylariales sp. PMI_506]
MDRPVNPFQPAYTPPVSMENIPQENANSPRPDSPQNVCRLQTKIIDNCSMARIIYMITMHYLFSGNAIDEPCRCPMLKCRKKHRDARSMIIHLSECPCFANGELLCPSCDEYEPFTFSDKGHCAWKKDGSTLRKVIGAIQRKCSGVRSRTGSSSTSPPVSPGGFKNAPPLHIGTGPQYDYPPDPSMLLDSTDLVELSSHREPAEMEGDVFNLPQNQNFSDSYRPAIAPQSDAYDLGHHQVTHLTTPMDLSCLSGQARQTADLPRGGSSRSNTDTSIQTGSTVSYGDSDILMSDQPSQADTAYPVILRDEVSPPSSFYDSSLEKYPPSYGLQGTVLGGLLTVSPVDEESDGVWQATSIVGPRDLLSPAQRSLSRDDLLVSPKHSQAIHPVANWFPPSQVYTHTHTMAAGRADNTLLDGGVVTLQDPSNLRRRHVARRSTLSNSTFSSPMGEKAEEQQSALRVEDSTRTREASSTEYSSALDEPKVDPSTGIYSCRHPSCPYTSQTPRNARTNFLRHLHRSHSTKEFRCGQCSHSFSRRDNLRRHLNSRGGCLARHGFPQDRSEIRRRKQHRRGWQQQQQEDKRGVSSFGRNGRHTAVVVAAAATAAGQLMSGCAHLLKRQGPLSRVHSGHQI